MPRYKVLAGVHVDEQKRLFTKGQIFSSTDELDLKFENKFERIGEETKTASTFNPSLDQTHIVDRPLHERLAADQAPDPGPPTARANPQADVRFAPNDGRGKPESTVAEAEPGDPDHPETADDGADGEEDKKGKFGKDVTAQFPQAATKDLRVYFKKDGGYVVTDADDREAKLNKKKLSDRKAAAKFLDDFK